MVCRRQPARARTDDRDLLGSRLVGESRRLQALLEAEVPDESLDLVDSDGAVLFSPVAPGFAGVRTNTPAHGGKRRRLHENLEGLLEGLLVGLFEILRLQDLRQHLSNGVLVGAGIDTRRALLDKLRPELRRLRARAATRE